MIGLAFWLVWILARLLQRVSRLVMILTSDAIIALARHVTARPAPRPSSE